MKVLIKEPVKGLWTGICYQVEGFDTDFAYNGSIVTAVGVKKPINGGKDFKVIWTPLSLVDLITEKEGE